MNKKSEEPVYEDGLQRVSVLIEPYISDLLVRLLENQRRKVAFRFSTRIRNKSDIINLCLSLGVKKVMKEVGITEDEV